MKAEKIGDERPFSDKAITEFFKVFTRVIGSAKDEKLRHVYPREWDLTYIRLPKVNKREQHRPTFIATEIVHIIKGCSGRSTGLRGFARGDRSPHCRLLALEIGKHILPIAR
jgi:hypothetical protein